MEEIKALVADVCPTDSDSHIKDNRAHTCEHTMVLANIEIVFKVYETFSSLCGIQPSLDSKKCAKSLVEILAVCQRVPSPQLSLQDTADPQCRGRR